MTRRHHLDKIPERKLDIVPATAALCTGAGAFSGELGELTNISDDSVFFPTTFKLLLQKYIQNLFM